MNRKLSRLKFHMVTSENFWVGAPIVIQEILKRDHYLSVFDDGCLPAFQQLLACDVFIDMSSITDKRFYVSLQEYFDLISESGKCPLMVDPPNAIISSFDKNLTHEKFSDLVPPSYRLDGLDNPMVISNFKSDRWVVIKDAVGWGGTSVERLSVTDALEKHAYTKGAIVQKYVDGTKGVGRIVTINHKDDFQIACSYTRLPKSWRTGVDKSYVCYARQVSDELYSFAKRVSRESGLYFNGIDYIFDGEKYYLLEVNAVPAIKEPLDTLGVDIASLLIDHIERNVLRSN